MTRVSFLKSAVAIAATAIGPLALAPAAQAHDWYVLSGESQTCVTGEVFLPQAPTPQQANVALRKEGDFTELKVIRDDVRKVRMVELTETPIGGRPAMVMWFPDFSSCEEMRKAQVAGGNLMDMSDLK